MLTLYGRHRKGTKTNPLAIRKVERRPLMREAADILQEMTEGTTPKSDQVVFDVGKPTASATAAWSVKPDCSSAETEGGDATDQGLAIPSFRDRNSGWGKSSAGQGLGEFFHEGREPMFRHVRDQLVEHASLPE